MKALKVTVVALLFSGSAGSFSVAPEWAFAELEFELAQVISVEVEQNFLALRLDKETARATGCSQMLLDRAAIDSLELPSGPYAIGFNRNSEQCMIGASPTPALLDASKHNIAQVKSFLESQRARAMEYMFANELVDQRISGIEHAIDESIASKIIAPVEICSLQGALWANTSSDRELSSLFYVVGPIGAARYEMRSRFEIAYYLVHSTLEGRNAGYAGIELTKAQYENMRLHMAWMLSKAEPKEPCNLE